MWLEVSRYSSLNTGGFYFAEYSTSSGSAADVVALDTSGARKCGRMSAGTSPRVTEVEPGLDLQDCTPQHLF